MTLETLGPTGLLPLFVVALAIASVRFAGLLLPLSVGFERLAASAVIAMALVHAVVGVLGTAGVLTTAPLLGAVGVLALGAWVATRSLPQRPWRRVFERHPWALALAVVPLGFAVVSAWLLPVWQWDSVGYHLPFVHFVIQSRGFAEVPADLHYISTYPHNIELGMIALRLLLPDDRLVDLAQVPYGVAGAVMTAAIAQKLSTRPSQQLAIVAGGLWLCLPCVFLQLPTNYVDVGTAAALLGAIYFLIFCDLSWRTLLLGGLALGIFLGSKPSAPMATALLGGFAAWRCWVAKERAAFTAFAALVLVFGGEMYLVMLVRHANPVWPVAVDVGPIHFPGTHAMTELLAAGSKLPAAKGTLVERLAASWLAVKTPPVFDMKLGGLGLPFLAALPFAVLALMRRRSVGLFVALAGALASPDPSLGRYVLAFAALVLAMALALLGELRVPRPLIWAPALVVAMLQLRWAAPGLTGDGPPLREFVTMSDHERRVAVGPHGRPTDYPPLWANIQQGEAVAFDEGFEFPGLLWSPTMHVPVLALPRFEEREAFETWVRQRNVRAVAVSSEHQPLLAQKQWQKLFDCRSTSCAVYLRASEGFATQSDAPN